EEPDHRLDLLRELGDLGQQSPEVRAEHSLERDAHPAQRAPASERLCPRATERPEVHRQLAGGPHRTEVDRVRPLAEEKHPAEGALALDGADLGRHPPTCYTDLLHAA